MKEDIIDGQVIDRTDSYAKKVINSKEIVFLKTMFYLDNPWKANREGQQYYFEISKIDEEYHLIEGYHNELDTVINEEVLVKVQEIIDNNNLVMMNGTDRFTSGLPVEYQPQSLYVTYESGEKLSLLCDGDPNSKWARELFVLFSETFGKAGIKDLLPDKEDVKLIKFRMSYDEDNLRITYSDISVPNKKDEIELKFMYCIYNKDENVEVKRKYIPLDNKIYTMLHNIVSKYDLINQEDINTSYKLSLYLEYQNGNVINYNSNEEDKYLPMVNELKEYFAKLYK